MDWPTAHRVVCIHATHLLADLGIAQNGYVDVLGRIAETGMTVMARPMRRLFGVYIPGSPRAGGGILLNSGLDSAALRHTAAHEWGHLVMGHGQCLTDDLDSLSTRSPAWTPQEMQAEAFAAWFLMPIPAVRRAVKVLGRRPGSAADVYQVSLQLGTSYRGTLRHLQNLKLVSFDQVRAWAKASPARLRRDLAGTGATDLPARVWDLGCGAADAALAVRAGDRLLVRGDWIGNAPRYEASVGVDIIPISSGLQVDVTSTAPPTGVLTVTPDRHDASGDPWTVTLNSQPPLRSGLFARDGVIVADSSEGE